MGLVYLATAPDQLTAEMWQNLLAQFGVQAVIRSGDAVSFLGVSPHPCRLMVLQEEQRNAKEILEGHLERELE